MAENRRRGAALGALLLAALFLLSVCSRRSAEVEQPVPFSHRQHAGEKKIDCRFCHPYVDRSQSAGIPSMQKCFSCHFYILPVPASLEEARKDFAQKKPIVWKRVFYLPDHVRFRHRPHVELGGLECAACHGPVETMDRLRAADFRMKFCIDCHERMKAPLDCMLSCHH